MDKADKYGYRHDGDIRRFMMNQKYERLYYAVMQEAEARCKDWEQKLRS